VKSNVLSGRGVVMGERLVARILSDSVKYVVGPEGSYLDELIPADHRGQLRIIVREREFMLAPLGDLDGEEPAPVAVVLQLGRNLNLCPAPGRLIAIFFDLRGSFFPGIHLRA
jgi:hypothetical protein